MPTDPGPITSLLHRWSQDDARFFGGLTVHQVAEVLGASVRTVEREWTHAKAYLLDTIGEHDIG